MNLFMPRYENLVSFFKDIKKDLKFDNENEYVWFNDIKLRSLSIPDKIGMKNGDTIYIA